jgi:hypothetical protein
MATITTVSHGNYLNTPRRSYIAVLPYNNDFFKYTTATTNQGVATGTLTSVTSDTTSTVVGTILRENGKKLYPGADIGISTYMVGVYDVRRGLNGYIDPNSYAFTIANTDKPYDTYETIPGTLGINPNSGAVYPNDRGEPVYTNGNVICGGFVSSVGSVVTNGNVINLGFISSVGSIYTNNNVINSGFISSVGNITTNGNTIVNGNVSVKGYVSTAHLYLNSDVPALPAVGSATVGVANMTGGIVIGIAPNAFRKLYVSTTAVTTTSHVFLTYSGINNAGVLSSEEIGSAPNTFRIVSNSSNDAGTVRWLVIN